MTKAPYYQNDDVVESFKVKDKKGQVIPVSVMFIVVDDVDNVYFEGMAEIEDNKVTAKVPSHATSDAGVYTVIYTITLPNRATRTHKQTYRILPKGFVVNKKFDEDFKLTPDSSVGEILSVKGNAIRALRRLGKSAEEAAEAVTALTEKTTKQRVAL